MTGLGFLTSLPGKIITAVVVLSLAYMAGQWHGRDIATEKAEARAAKATIEQLKERGLINEQVRNISDCALARELNPGVVCDDGDE